MPKAAYIPMLFDIYLMDKCQKSDIAVKLRLIKLVPVISKFHLRLELGYWELKEKCDHPFSPGWS